MVPVGGGNVLRRARRRAIEHGANEGRFEIVCQSFARELRRKMSRAFST
jgi:hypothetical protein